jgi:hypothetical protein
MLPMRWNPVLLNSRYARLVIYLVATIIILPRAISLLQSAQPYNGFDVSDSLIPVDRIEYGGPPRDGIPALDKPRFVSTSEAGFLRPDDRVLGLNINGSRRAYPVRILNYHEIVNDRFGERPVTITWCPLCGSGIAFAADVDKGQLHFGVSGLLYNSDMLLYDRETESLWSQLMGRAISGPQKGKRLTMLPLVHTSWNDWRSRFPDSRVLSLETGFNRDYTRSPYPGYETSEDVYFAVDHVSRRYHPKEQVIGLEIDGVFKAYPFTELGKARGDIVDEVAGRKIRVTFLPEHGTGQIFLLDGTELATVTSYWFAWYSFHPDTDIYQTR